MNDDTKPPIGEPEAPMPAAPPPALLPNPLLEVQIGQPQFALGLTGAQQRNWVVPIFSPRTGAIFVSVHGVDAAEAQNAATFVHRAIMREIWR